MKKDTKLEKFHFGSMIQKIALQKDIPSQKVADRILLYQKNPNKIYQVNDMDCDNIVKISYLLEYNFLNVISEKYLSHLPLIETIHEQEIYYIEWDMQSKHFFVNRDLRNDGTLKNIYIGRYIRAFAEKNEWDEQYMADLLECSQCNISNLYTRKSLTVKKIIQISDALKHNFIAEVYLNRMFITSSPSKFSNCIMTMSPQEVRIENPDDKTFLMVFHRKHVEK